MFSRTVGVRKDFQKAIAELRTDLDARRDARREEGPPAVRGNEALGPAAQNCDQRNWFVTSWWNCTSEALMRAPRALGQRSAWATCSDENALLALDQERGTRARVGFLVNQPRTFGVTTRVNLR